MLFSRGASSQLLLCTLLLTVPCLSIIQRTESIDREEPIVRSSPDGNNTGDMFGYSVVLHQVQEPQDFLSAIQHTRIMAGAPKGSFPGGISNLNTSTAENETGLVYQCPVNLGECGPIGDGSLPVFDGQPNGTNLDPDTPFLDPTAMRSIGEQKSGQLMGQMLRSSGDYFLACAPRWIANSNAPINAEDNRRSLGRCFISGRTLTNFTEIRPCRGITSGTVPLDRNDNRCQAGFGATLYRTAPSETTKVALGAPGFGDRNGGSKGIVFVYDDPTTLTPGVLDSRQGDRQTAPLPPASTNVRRNSLYEGWSLATGNVNTNTFGIVSSVPRYDGYSLAGRINVRAENSLRTVMASITGTQTGEYFGHVVETADLNGDGLVEIIVGAPLWSAVNKPELGRVLIYPNNQGSYDESAPIILAGTAVMGRFGHSVVSLGDINGDDIEDIAIGSPYEATSDPNAVGVVRVYYGNRNSVISREPDQTISSADIRQRSGLSRLSTFGFSLSSGVDVDFNQYNDLVVGAYDSQTVVLLRTHSIAMVSFNLSTDMGTIVFEGSTNFIAKVCARYSGRGLDNRPLNVSFTLTEVAGRLNNDIVNRASQSSYFDTLRFPSANTTVCQNVTVQLRSINDLPNGFRLRDPFEMSLSFNDIPRPNQTATNQLADFRESPLISAIGNPVVSVNLTLGCSLTDAQGEEVCAPDLAVEIRSVTYRGVDSMDRGIIVANDVTVVRFELRVENLATEPAISANLRFTLPSGFPFTGVNLINPPMGVACNNPNNDESYVCTLPTYMEGPSPIDLTMDWTVDSTSVIGMEPNMTALFSVDLPDTSPDNDTNPGNNMASQTLGVTAITDATVGLTVVGRGEYDNMAPSQFPTMLSDIGEPVEINVQISNNGPSIVPRARVEINVPITPPSSNNMGLYFYVAERLPRSHPQLMCSDAGVNPDRFILSGRARRRRSLSKRQTPTVIGEAASCSFEAPNPSCQMFICNITNLRPRQQFPLITLRTALDRRFYQGRMDSFSFNMFARIISLDGFAQFDSMDSNNVNNEVYDIRPPPVPPINIYLEIWLPILGALLALIFIIIVFGLCIYCGFFRKKRLEEAKKQQAGGEFEVRQVPPEAPAVEGVTGEPGHLQEKSKSDEALDIGDIADLEEGEDINGETKTDIDPEETSL